MCVTCAEGSPVCAAPSACGCPSSTLKCSSKTRAALVRSSQLPPITQQQPITHAYLQTINTLTGHPEWVVWVWVTLATSRHLDVGLVGPLSDACCAFVTSPVHFRKAIYQYSQVPMTQCPFVLCLVHCYCYAMVAAVAATKSTTVFLARPPLSESYPSLGGVSGALACVLAAA